DEQRQTGVEPPSDARAVQQRTQDEEGADRDDQQHFGAHGRLRRCEPPITHVHVGADIAPHARWSNRRRTGAAGPTSHSFVSAAPTTRFTPFQTCPARCMSASPSERGAWSNASTIQRTVVAGSAETFGRTTGFSRVPVT